MNIRSRRSTLAMVVILTLVGLGLYSSLARAASVPPVLVLGNPSCTTQGYPAGFKIDAWDQATFPITNANFPLVNATNVNGGFNTLLTGSAVSDPSKSVTISSTDGVFFDWSSTFGIDAVIVKGGPNSNVYIYDPPTEATSDTALSSPLNNTDPFEISHVEFCFDYETATNTPTNTATVTPTDTQLPTATHTPTNTPTNTPLPTATHTPTDTPTNTPLPPTNTPTDTPTNTPLPTATHTPTDTPTNTPLPTATHTPTNTPTNTPLPTVTHTPTATSTLTRTPTTELGQLKVCKSAGPGVTKGQAFTVTVGNTAYTVRAGYCILAGQFSLNTQVTLQETIPPGYFVASITVAPGTRQVSQNTSLGQVVVRIGSGVTEVTFRNATSSPTSTKPPATSVPPQGFMQICKEADGEGVSGYFTFRFGTQSRSVPVDACSRRIGLNAGTLTITEDARAGYQVSDIYTIPADRLISKDINARTVTVTIVAGDESSQTVVVFVNRAETTNLIPGGTLAANNASTGTALDLASLWRDFLAAIFGTSRKPLDQVSP